METERIEELEKKLADPLNQEPESQGQHTEIPEGSASKRPKPKRTKKPKQSKKGLFYLFWRKLSLKHRVYLCVIILVTVFSVATGFYVSHQIQQNNNHDMQVVTVSTLEKIVNVNELNTFTAVYNGIAEVANEKKPEKIDYYVSYKAQVKAGLDFDKIGFEIDDETKTIKVLMPAIKINETPVDIDSLDFIFYNQKANKPAVSQEAYKACVADVKAESIKENAILELAKENAENVITALITPIVKQYDPNYEISVEWEAK